jgi:hypothetical protein
MVTTITVASPTSLNWSAASTARVDLVEHRIGCVPANGAVGQQLASE